jgi:23S rRNA (cytosine1962-C5)-methyltransferase
VSRQKSNFQKPEILKLRITGTLQNKIRRGYPWVFRYQVRNRTLSGKPGDLGVIYDGENRFLAIGLYDPYSDIILRVLQTGEPADVDRAFFAARFRRALDLRAPLEAEGTTGYRALNGENDGFPGLALDRYGGTAVVKIYSRAWIPHLDKILPCVESLLRAERCVLRLSRNARDCRAGDDALGDGQILFGTPLDAPARFRENGLRFEADVFKGQKTGFYFDQRDNRRLTRDMARDKTVLNVFSYSGGFSVYAFAGGCRSVREIDLNPHAMLAAKANVALNFPERAANPEVYRQTRGDAFAELDRLRGRNRMFDMTILDPPAFARNARQAANALRAYARLAEAGARVTSDGGILCAASCSAPVAADDFREAVDAGIRAAGRDREVLMKTGHALDHPVTFDEGNYLKAVFCRITHRARRNC